MKKPFQAPVLTGQRTLSELTLQVQCSPFPQCIQ